MDDVEDDAGYPPNSYPASSHHRPKPQFQRDFNDQEEEDEDETNSDGDNNDHHHHRDDASAADNSGHHHHAADHAEEPEDEEAVGDGNDDVEDDSSVESRGKRRKLDNFEFVPRKQQQPPPPAAAPSPKPLSGKSSAPDWSEDSTFVLLESWGDLFIKNERKSIRSEEWSEVAKKVNQSSRTPRTDSQCRNRVDTLKKKYKKEKVRLAEHPNFRSEWVYFKKMDSLMSSPLPAPAATVKSSPVRLSCGVDAGEYVFANSRVYLNRANAMDEMRDSPGDTGTDDERDANGDESDGLPPTLSGRKKGRGLSSFRMLADSIRKFAETYERIEGMKRQQMVEMERMRQESQREFEAQMRQMLERAQADIVRMRQDEMEEEEEEEEEGRLTGDGDGDGDGEDGEDGDVDGSADNLSG